MISKLTNQINHTNQLNQRYRQCTSEW